MEIETMSELGLDTVRTRGRVALPIVTEVVRELTRKDLEYFSEEKGTKSPALTRIRSRHHALARALAGGMPVGEAALMVGLSLNRVSILQADPGFQELLKFYEADIDRVYRDVHESLASLSYDAVEELRTRLEDEPEKLTPGQLLEMAKMGADRTGHGPQSSTTNVNVNVDLATRMEQARRRLAEHRKTIEASPVDE